MVADALNSGSIARTGFVWKVDHFRISRCFARVAAPITTSTDKNKRDGERGDAGRGGMIRVFAASKGERLFAYVARHSLGKSRFKPFHQSCDCIFN